MDKSDLQRFARRDWDAVAASKVEHWVRLKKARGPAEAVRAAEALQQQVVALRPAWPTEKDRSEDLATHARVAACLRRVLSTRAH